MTDGKFGRLLFPHLLIILRHHSCHLIVFLCLYIFRCQYSHFGPKKQTHLKFYEVHFESVCDLLLKFQLGQLHSFQVLLALFLCLRRLFHGFFYPLGHFFVVVLALLLYTHLLCGFFYLLNQDHLIPKQILVGSCQRLVFLSQSDGVIDFSVLSFQWCEGLLQLVRTIFMGGGGMEACAGYGNIIIWSLQVVHNQGAAVLSCINHICVREVEWGLASYRNIIILFILGVTPPFP
jgi:hypothetical protein